MRWSSTLCSKSPFLYNESVSKSENDGGWGKWEGKENVFFICIWLDWKLLENLK